MASKTNKMKQQEERIKQLICQGYRNGVCDKNGNSCAGPDGNLRPLYENRNSSVTRKFVIRNGKCVEKT